jgi:hypothetical protein
LPTCTSISSASFPGKGGNAHKGWLKAIRVITKIVAKSREEGLESLFLAILNSSSMMF